MAPRDTRTEAFQAGQENPYIGAIGPLQRLYGTLGAIGEEFGGSDMGTPVGTKFKARQAQTKADIKRLQELREKHPEEFGRGQMMAQQQADPYELGLGLGTLGAMTPYGRTTFDMAGGGKSPEGIFRNPELGYAPRAPRGRGPGPEGPTINAGFDVPRGMNRFDANQYYFTHGIPGEDIYYRSNPAMPLPTSRNAFEEASVLAANKTRPSPAPAYYDYPEGAGPGAATGRPMSQFDRNSMDAYYRNTGRGQYGPYVPGSRSGPGAMPLDYTLDELGQAVGPAMSRGMVPQRGGLPMMAEGRGIPYGEFRDVTGNVLRGPAGPMEMGASMATRMGEGAYQYEPSIASRMGYGAYQYEPIGAAPRGGVPMFAYPAAAAGALGAKAYFGGGGPAPSGAVGQPQLGPYDFGMMPGPRGMEAMDNLPPAGMGAPENRTRTAPNAGARKPAGVPLPPRRPQIGPPQDQFEGNFNYDVTRLIDSLVGGNEAERGRMMQQYYEQNPY